MKPLEISWKYTILANTIEKMLIIKENRARINLAEARNILKIWCLPLLCIGLICMGAYFEWNVSFSYALFCTCIINSPIIFWASKYFINYLFIKDLSLLLEKISKFDVLIFKDINSINMIEEILEVLTEIRALLSQLLKKKKKLWVSFFKTQISFFIDIIIDLRSDLTTRLTEQQQILESAKWEVEQNIVGTPELLAVSEAQKLRLDSQIEQFEELQRVLVRV